MPELPEVETIKRGLMECCVGKKIRNVEVLCEKSFLGPQNLIENATIVAIRRFGKALVIDLSNKVSMMIHLRMTGQIIYRANAENLQGAFAGGHPTDSFLTELPNKQTRVIFELDRGRIYFNDQRKFGFVKVLPTDEVEQDAFIAKLAPEPWDMTAQEFYDRLQKHKNMVIKAALLDQTVICGLGNIYADETLFDAGIHPESRVGEISLEDAERILIGAKSTMEASIKAGGSTMATYVKSDGTKGNYLELFAQVFQRHGQECRRCGAEIIKMRVAGRGTHCCINCQEKKI